MRGRSSGRLALPLPCFTREGYNLCCPSDTSSEIFKFKYMEYSWQPVCCVYPLVVFALQTNVSLLRLNRL